MPYVILFFAIVAETIGTAALQSSQQFSRLGPTALALGAYAISIFLLGLALKYMPVGIAYALWSGLGIVMISLIGFALYGQRLDMPAVFGISLILAGIFVIHLFSATAPH